MQPINARNLTDQKIKIGNAYEVNPVFPGPYVATPTRETQVLHTEGFKMISDVIFNPIPQNYGLVEYDGFSLRIS